MDNPFLQLLVLFFLLVLNGLFALAEIAIVSARPSRLREWADNGHAGARAALALAQNPVQFLSTVQIGITLIGIIAGAFGGATIAANLEPYLRKVPVLADSSGPVSVALVVVVVTYLSLVVGELAPKRIALTDPERFAATVAIPMRQLSLIFAPVVSVLSVSTALAVRLFGIRGDRKQPVTEAEVRALLEQATRIGVFEEAEQEMVEGVLRLDDRRVEAFMTPRTQAVWLDLDDTPDEVSDKIVANPYARFPVAEGTLDNLVGIVRANEILAHALEGEPLDLRRLVHEPLFVPEAMATLDVLALLKQQDREIAFVVDEYGGLQGLVTVRDILDGILTALPDGAAGDEPRAQESADGSFLVDGMMPIDDFKALFHIDHLPDESTSSYQTLGGFVVSWLTEIPVEGISFTWERYRFEVVDMDQLRVDKVLVVDEGAGNGE